MIRRIFREWAYDLKEPGIHLWMIPLVSLAFVVMTFFVQKSLDISGKTNFLTLPMVQALIPSLGGYGALMLMQGLFDTEGGELAFVYPRTRLYWGLIRQLRFFILYALWVFLICKLVSDITRDPANSPFALILTQCFAVMGAAFLGTTASKKVGIGMVVLVAFVGIQFVMGQFNGSLNWIYDMGQVSMLPESMQTASPALNALLIGAFSWGLGQVWLRPPR